MLANELIPTRIINQTLLCELFCNLKNNLIKTFPSKAIIRNSHWFRIINKKVKMQKRLKILEIVVRRPLNVEIFSEDFWLEIFFSRCRNFFEWKNQSIMTKSFAIRELFAGIAIIAKKHTTIINLQFAETNWLAHLKLFPWIGRRTF